MASKHPTILITKDDLRKIIYFILMKFRGDSLHRQGTSAKRDLIGGYIERWFNKIAEGIIFDSLLQGKNYKVVPDFFVYGNDSEKNAPDILGIKTKEGKITPFARYNNGTWVGVPDMPRVEVKVVRKDQTLLGVREPQMIDDYYAFIESDLEGDYLSAIFEDEVFQDKYFEELAMENDFIQSDEANQLVQPIKQQKAEAIGTIRLIGIYTKAELLKNTVLCIRGVSPHYFAEAVSVETGRGLGSSPEEYLEVPENGLVKYQSPNGSISLPFSIIGLSQNKVKVLKKNIGSLYIETPEPLTINSFEVKQGIVKLVFKEFERSSGWAENVASKFVLEYYSKDDTDELISKLDSIAGSGLS